MSDKEIRETIVSIVLHSTVLIGKIDELEKSGAEKVWIQRIKQTGKKFRDELVKYTNRQEGVYSSDTCETLYNHIEIIEGLSDKLTIENIDKIVEVLR